MATRTGRAGRLKGFRLADVPIEIRRRYARQVARSADRELASDARPEARLLGRLADLTLHGGDILEIAEEPSERVYWVSRKAWDTWVGDRT